MAYPGQGGPSMGAPQMPPTVPQQMPPQPSMPPQPTTGAGPEDMGGGAGGAGMHVAPPPNKPPTPQDQQAELISFD